jgi:hypothetical protein
MTNAKLYLCPDCKCQFVQPFKCTTCGALKLYDATVKSQAETIEHQRDRIESIFNVSIDGKLGYKDRVARIQQLSQGFMQ